MSSAKEKAIEMGVDERFIVKIAGTEDDWCILYVGLLDFAHKKGVKENKFLGFQEPNYIKIDSENCECVISVYAVFENGFKTIGTGHVSKANIGKEKYLDFYIASAETRAKARALRDALNIPLVSAEELIDDFNNNSENKTSSKISDKQKSFINKLLDELNRSIDKTLEKIGVKTIDDLTSQQADTIIKKLKAYKENEN